MRKFKMTMVMVGVLSSLALGACVNSAKNATKSQNEMMSESMEEMKAEDMSDKMEDGMKDDMKSDDMKSDDMKDEMKMDDMKDDMKDEMKASDMKSSEMKNDSMMNEDYTLKDMDGNTVSLSSFNGKKVYAKFWASWCSICLAGLEDVDKLSAEDKDFEVITIVSPKIRGEKSKEDFIEWFKTLEYKNIKVLFDEEGKLAKKYGVTAYPTSLYINADGSNTEVKVGHYSNDLIKENIAKLQ